MENKSSQLKAGASQVEITPKAGIQIAGDIGRHRPTEQVVDPIFAKALILESEGQKLCFLSLDLLGITTEWANNIRQQASEKFGIDQEAIMVHITQTHAAPAMGHFMISDRTKFIPPELQWLRGGDDNYNQFALERIMEAIELANSSLQNAQIGSASGIDGRIAFNRRYIMRDGTVRTHPPKVSPDIRYVEGPIDPEVGVLCVKTESSDILAIIGHHTCHPCHGYPLKYISAGWPGTWSKGIREIYGEKCVPLILNGCCGNIHHVNPLDPGYVDDHNHMGKLLTETTSKVLNRINYQDKVLLDWKVKTIKIPIRELDSKELEKARILLAQNPEPMWRDKEHIAVEWDWVYAVAYLDLYESRQIEPEANYEIQVLRAGNTAFVGLGGEPFVEGQLRIKLKSIAYPTYVAHMCNGFMGYIPTKHAFDGGGYETRTANWSKLAPEALDMIADEAIDLIKEVFK
jgi:neutral ceramidase